MIKLLSSQARKKNIKLQIKHVGGNDKGEVTADGECAVGLNTSNTCVLLLDTDSKDSCVYLTHAHVVSHRQGLMILLSYEDPGRCNVMFFRLYFSHFFSIMQFSR